MASLVRRVTTVEGFAEETPSTSLGEATLGAGTPGPQPSMAPATAAMAPPAPAEEPAPATASIPAPAHSGRRVERNAREQKRPIRLKKSNEEGRGEGR